MSKKITKNKIKVEFILYGGAAGGNYLAHVWGN